MMHRQYANQQARRDCRSRQGRAVRRAAVQGGSSVEEQRSYKVQRLRSRLEYVEQEVE